MFALMCPNYEMIEQFFHYNETLKFIDSDLLTTLLNFASNQEVVPTLTSIFKAAVPVLEKRYGIKIPHEGDEIYPLEIDNLEFKSNPMMEKMGSIYESLNFDKSVKDIIKPKKLESYHADFGYSITSTGIKIDSAKAMKLIFQTAYGDTNAMFTLMEMLTPLFRDIKGGLAIVQIASILAKGRKDKIFDHMSNLVRLIIIGMISERLETKKIMNVIDDGISLSEQDIKQFSESFDFTNNMIRGIVASIRGALLLLDKDAANIKLEDYRNVFMEMCDAVSAYEKEIGREDLLVHNAAKQVDLMIAIIGLAKGNYKQIEVVGKLVGCYENKKVREVMNIINKYKDIIFRKPIYGLPPMTLGVSDLSSAANAVGNMAASTAKDAIASGANNALNQLGAYQIPGTGVSVQNVAAATGLKNLAQTSIKGLGKFPPIANLGSINPDELIFGDMFKQFDKDRSGYIDYNEFCELTKYMGLNLDKENSLRLFSMADRNSNNQIDISEFKYAVTLLKLQIAKETLKKLGLTMEDLIWYGVLGILFLLQLFAFIFLGIVAFSKSADFNSIVNAIMPVIAGIAAGSRRIDIKEAIEKVKSVVEKLVTKLKQST